MIHLPRDGRRNGAKIEPSAAAFARRALRPCDGAAGGACAFERWSAAQGLSREVAARMAPLWRSNVYHRGDVIFYQGNAPASVYFLCTGSVKLVRDARMGRQHILRMIGAPDFIGERAFLAGQPYAASAQVMEESRVCAIDGASFRAQWRAEPELARMLAIYLSRKLAEADEAACDMALRTIRELLARLIAERLTEEGGDLVQFSESRQDMADILGTSAEVISRTLSEFERKKILAREGRGLRILDKERLRIIGGVQAKRPDFYQSGDCETSMRSGPAGNKIYVVPMSKNGNNPFRPIRPAAPRLAQELASAGDRPRSVKTPSGRETNRTSKARRNK